MIGETFLRTELQCKEVGQVLTLSLVNISFLTLVVRFSRFLGKTNQMNFASFGALDKD